MEITRIYVISQVITVAYYLLLSSSYFLKDRRKILVVNFWAHIGQTAAMGLLGGFTGAAMAMIMAGRDLVFRILAPANQGSEEQNEHDRNSVSKKRGDLVILVITIVLIVVLTIFTYNGPLSLLSVVATMISTLAVWQKNVRVYQLLGIIVALLWLAYNIVIMSIMGIILQTILAVASTVGFIHGSRKTKTVP